MYKLKKTGQSIYALLYNYKFPVNQSDNTILQVCLPIPSVAYFALCVSIVTHRRHSASWGQLIKNIVDS